MAALVQQAPSVTNNLPTSPPPGGQVKWDKAQTKGFLVPEDQIEELLPPGARGLLEDYSRIAPEEVVPHIARIQRQGYAICPYPCIGRVRFLGIKSSKYPSYTSNLQRLKAGQHYLDLGCCFGQDIRKLVLDGAPSENITGVDIEPRFFELSYDLFLDRQTLKASFLAADLFNTADQVWRPLRGTQDMINCSSFLHLWNYEKQLAAAEIIATLLRPVRGSTVFGFSLGGVVAGEEAIIANGQTTYCHNVETFREMWNLVGRRMGMTFKVDGDLADIGDDMKFGVWNKDNYRSLTFTVVLLEVNESNS